MSLQAAFHQCLLDGNFRGLRVLHTQIAPHEPRITSDAQAEVAMHMARTQMASLPFRGRAWSHRWLSERGYPSQLPDALRVQAERVYPRVVEAVGIAVKVSRSGRAAEALAVRTAMEDAVLEMFADGVRDPVQVSARMLEARERVHRQA